MKCYFIKLWHESSASYKESYVITTEKYTGFRNDTYIIPVGTHTHTHTHRVTYTIHAFIRT